MLNAVVKRLGIAFLTCHPFLMWPYTALEILCGLKAIFTKRPNDTSLEEQTSKQKGPVVHVYSSKEQ